MIESIKSIVIEMGVSSLFGKLSNYKNKKDIKIALNSFIESQQQNVFELSNLDNEIDYSALTDYIKKESFNEITAYIICTNSEEIDPKLQTILAKAKSYARANNADKESVVEKFVVDVIRIIQMFYNENVLSLEGKLITRNVIDEFHKITTHIPMASSHQDKIIQLLTIQNMQLIDEKEQLVDENNCLVNEKFKEIVQVDIYYGSDTAWEMLKSYVENIENAKNKNYTRYFYYAAQHCLLIDMDLSEKYFNIAKSLSPTVDTRVYESSKLIIQGKFNDAVELLSNIDNIAVLNQLLNIAFISEDNLNINDLIQNAEIETNEYTEYLIESD